MMGEPTDAPHMTRAREAIRSRGGAIHSNVFTRFMLAMFGVLSWRSVPVLPVEIMLLPRWSPFHLNKISYWARTTIVPLMVLAALKPRARAIDSAVAFVEERLNGEDGLGAIYPPMANTVMMFEVLGKPADYPPRALTRRGLDRLLVIGEHEAYCQPCVSPVWDTALTCHAMLEAGGEASPSAKRGLDWLLPRQVLD